MKYCIVHKDISLANELLDKIKKEVKMEYSEESPDFVITLGGDGTILRAFHMYPNAVIFAVHAGHLGFYTNYKIEELDKVIDSLNNHRYKVSILNLLNISFNDGKELKNIDALNEVTITSPLRTLILDIYVDNDYFERFRGTGLCICTPTGSTAYNKSLHGAVIDFNIGAIELTEIAGINSNSYRTLASPVVLSNDRKIILKNIKNEDAYLTIDNYAYTLNDVDEVRVKMSTKFLKMAFHENESFIRRLNRTFLISKD